MVTEPDIPIADLYRAAKRPEVVAAVGELYAEMDRRIAEHAPVCWNKGECCRFGQYGHRLYVTALEAAYYLAYRADGDAAGLAVADWSLLEQQTCPHAVAGRCHARSQRPLGCRVFYCDPAAQGWQGPMTEEYLGRLRKLHEDLEVPYFYADWLTVLAALRSAGATSRECD